MQCHFMAKLFAKVVVVLAHNHLKYKGSVLVFTYWHAFFVVGLQRLPAGIDETLVLIQPSSCVNID